MVKIVKRKATGFFRAKDKCIINQTIQDHHVIISETSLLIKNYYLRWFRGGDDKKPTERKPLIIDKDLITLATLVVQRKSYNSRGGLKSQVNHYNFGELKSAFDDVYGAGHEGFPSSLSISHVLAYGCQNLLTAFENNITMHFLKYPKKYIRCDLIQQGVPLKQAKLLSWSICNHFMYDVQIDDTIANKPEIVNNLESYSLLFPKKVSNDKPLCYEIVVSPFTFLPYMVHINNSLEVLFPDVDPGYKKLYNPFPLHTTFVSMHVRFDTSGLAQLLMDIEQIKDFSNQYDIMYGWKPMIKDKGDLLSTSSKIFPGRVMSDEDEHLYATEIWNYMTNLKTCKQHTEIFHVVKNTNTAFVFDNAVVTDGTSISFQVTERDNMHRKKRKKRNISDEGDIEKDKKVKKKSKHTATCDCDTSDGIRKEKELERSYVQTKKCLGNDPGKTDILAITDGVSTLCYTRKQRNEDTHLGFRTRKSLRKRRENDIDVFESEVLSACSKKSCSIDTFSTYCRERNSRRQDLKKVYEKPHFSQSKFHVFAKTKSSEMKFFNKIQESFAAPVDFTTSKYKNKMKNNRCVRKSDLLKSNAEKSAETKQDFAIAYGDGGKGMNNLKGTPSAPNVSIKRHLEQYFKVVVQPEHFTSKTCPCCKERTLNNPSFRDLISDARYEKHHLLRCTNDECESRWWNRNVAGSLNILERYLTGT